MKNKLYDRFITFAAMVFISGIIVLGIIGVVLNFWLGWAIFS